MLRLATPWKPPGVEFVETADGPGVILQKFRSAPVRQPSALAPAPLGMPRRTIQCGILAFAQPRFPNWTETTIDLPEELYRALKARAALNGKSMRDVVVQLIVQGLRSPPLRERGRRPPPPIIVSPRGVCFPALSGEKKVRLEEAEDEAKHARSARR